MVSISDEQRNETRFFYAVVFCALVMVYALSGVSNRIESVDGYLYAGAAQFLNFADVHDPRSLLFHKINQAIAAANAAAGMPFDTYSLLCVPTVFAGALGVILMHRLLRRYLLLSNEASVVGAGLLAVSYGYWRYANEIEVYIPSICFILGVLCLLCQRLKSELAHTFEFVGPGIISGLAVLYYQANALPLFVAMPVLFITSKRFTAFVAYAFSGSAVVVAGLAMAYFADSSGNGTVHGFLSFLGRRSEEFPAPEVEIISLARGAFAIMRDIISLNWLYGLEHGRAVITKYAAAHAYYHEGHFFAAAQSHWFVKVAPFTFAAAFAGLAALAISSVRSRFALHSAARPLFAFLVAWLFVHAAVVIYLDPAEMEVWIVSLVPICALFALLVDKSYILQRWPFAAVTVVLLLALHNFAGGLQIFAHSDGDLYSKQVRGILKTARSGDFVLFTGPYPPAVKPVRLLVEKIEGRDQRAADAGHFITPVYSDGETAMIYRFDEHLIKKLPIEDMLREIRLSGHRLIVPEETLRPRPLPPKLGGEERFNILKALGARLGQSAQKIYDDRIGATYLVAP